jgi:ligand-binding sensor domain-containing protein
MWFASIDGINMYDGYEITVFKNIPGDSTSLPHNRTFRGFEDSEGTIWISTESGLARFNRNSKTFTTFKYSDSDAEPSNRVIDIFEDSKNMLWVTTQNGTLEFDRVKEKFNSYDVIKTDNNIATFGAYSGVITENKAGELYNFSWSFGLLKFDYEGSVFVQIDLKDNFNDYLSSKVYFDSVFDPDGNLWIGFSDGLAKIDLKEMTAYDITPFQRQKNPNGWDCQRRNRIIS